MPTKRRPRERHQRRSYSDAVIRYLETGVRKGPGVLQLFPYDRREVWCDLREQLLAEWVSEHPGTRPFAWWTYDAPEPLGEGESQVQYLTRLGLMDANERRRLDAETSPIEAA